MKNKNQFLKISLLIFFYFLFLNLFLSQHLHGATYNIKATWEPSIDPDVKEYRLYKKVSGVKELIGITSHPNTSYGPFPIIVPDGSYGSILFVVTAIDFAGLESAESEPAYFDYDERVYIQFEKSHSAGSESISPASIKVILSKASDQTITVNYLTRDETAIAENDYHSSTGTLIFPPGTTIQTINVPIINDTKIEKDKKFIVELSNPVNAILGTITSHTYTIIDDDRAGTIQFGSPNYLVNEKEGSVTIPVTRRNGKDGIVSVDYLTIDGTAKSGINYIPVKGTLIWDDGDDTEKIFTIPILKDNKLEGKITVNLILENVSGGATLGNPDIAILTIIDGRRNASIFFDDFSTEKGWMGLQKNGWERKSIPPINKVSSFLNSERDNYNYILGIDMGNEHPDNLSEKSVISPPIDCSGRNRILLKFKSWLNIESSKFNHAQIYISNDGINWGEPIWENPPIDLMDHQWVPIVIDISDIAADQKTVYVKFIMGPTYSPISSSSWNIDDFEITEEAIFPSEGTLGTKITIYGSGFGLKRGRVFIGNPVVGNISLKINEWRDDLIVCSLDKVLMPGIYDITVQPVGPKGIPFIVYKESFVVRGADIYSVDRTEGTSYDYVTITGKFFGTKMGRVYLEYEEEGIDKVKPCRIIKWSMDSITGDSEVVFEIPRILPAVCEVILDPYEDLEKVELEEEFTVRPPKIENINPDSGMQGELVTISGKYFGSKKPTVYLGYMNEKDGKYKKTGCSLVSWNDNEIVFRIPKLPSGTYDIIVKNATSSDTRVNGLIINHSGL